MLDMEKHTENQGISLGNVTNSIASQDAKRQAGDICDDWDKKQFCMVEGGYFGRASAQCPNPKARQVSLHDIYLAIKDGKIKEKALCPILVNPAYKTDRLIEKSEAEKLPKPNETGFFAVDIDFHDRETAVKMVRRLKELPFVVFAATTARGGVWALCRGENVEACHIAVGEYALEIAEEREIIDDDEYVKNNLDVQSPIDSSFWTETTWRARTLYPDYVEIGMGAFHGYISLHLPTKKETREAFMQSNLAKIALRFMPQMKIKASDLARSWGTGCALSIPAMFETAVYGYGTTPSACSVCGNFHAAILSRTRAGKTTALKTVHSALEANGVKYLRHNPKTGESLETSIQKSNVEEVEDKDGNKIKRVKTKRPRHFITIDEAGSKKAQAKTAKTAEGLDAKMRMFMDGFIMTENSAGNVDDRYEGDIPVEGAGLEFSTPAKYALAITGDDEGAGESSRKYPFYFDIPKPILEKISAAGRKGFLDYDRKEIAKMIPADCANAIAPDGGVRKIFMTKEAYFDAVMYVKANPFPEKYSQDRPEMIARISGSIAQLRPREQFDENERTITTNDVRAALFITEGILESRKAINALKKVEAKTEQSQWIDLLYQSMDEQGGSVSGRTVADRLADCKDKTKIGKNLDEMWKNGIISPVDVTKTAINGSRWTRYDQSKQHPDTEAQIMAKPRFPKIEVLPYQKDYDAMNSEQRAKVDAAKAAWGQNPRAVVDMAKRIKGKPCERRDPKINGWRIGSQKQGDKKAGDGMWIGVSPEGHIWWGDFSGKDEPAAKGDIIGLLFELGELQKQSPAEFLEYSQANGMI